MSKCEQLPTIECRFKTNCYRKDRNHFTKFAHSHIQNIVQVGKQNGKYMIPNELNFRSDIIQFQCEIVEKLFFNLISDQADKKLAVTKQGEENARLVKDNGVLSEVLLKGTKHPKATEMKMSHSSSLSSSASNETIKENKEKKRDPKVKYSTDVHEYFDVVAPRGDMARKLVNAAPYNFFLTTITSSIPTHSEPLSVTFMELLDESLGKLENSVQINFVVDFSWLMTNYYFAGQE